MNTRLLRKLLAVTAASLMGLVAAVSSHAQTTVTITAVANQVGYQNDYPVYGYTFGQTYTFSFTIAPNIPEGPFESFAYYGSYAYYEPSSLADANLFSAVGGTGLTGTYSAPGNLSHYINVYPNGNIPYFRISVGSNSTFGINAADGTTPLTKITFDINDPNVGFTYTDSYVDPATYFDNYNTFNGYVTGSEANSYFQNNNSVNPTVWLYLNTGDYLSFAPTAISIVGTAVPEPSTYAAIAGLGALALVAYRRRRVAA